MERFNRVNGISLPNWRWNVVLFFILHACIGSEALFAEVAVSMADTKTDDKVLENRISELITQLGSDHYSTRRQAQDQLKKIGVPALDQLRDAIRNSDPQIVSAARYLVNSSFTNWTNENDPLEVRRLLEHYGTLDGPSREDRIKRLAILSVDRGLPALLRIARFESSGELSRRAAISILLTLNSRYQRVSNERDNQRWETVFEAASQGKNQACEWLAEFALIKTSKKTIDSKFWFAAVEKESTLLADKTAEVRETSRGLFVEFTRFVAEQLAKYSLPNDALQVAKGLLDIDYGTRDRRDKALDFCLWALENGFPSLVIEQCEKPWIQEPSIRRTHLDYLRAEGHLRLGQAELSEEFAQRAFSRNQKNPSNDVLLSDRKDKGDYLRLRGLYDWSKREYQAAIAIADPLDPSTVEMVVALSSMLADGLDYASAVEILKPTIDRFEKEPSFANDIDHDPRFSFGRMSVFENAEAATFSNGLRSKYLHYRATSKIDAGDLSQAKQDLRDAIKADPENIDISITMWKNRGDEDWNRESEENVVNAIKKYREAIPKLERALRSNSSNDVATYQFEYANTLNTYAWILVCTDRELDAALECSQLACQVTPNQAAYLDTLARCYFKVGRIQEAVQTQLQSVALEPSSRELKRALTEYQAALPK